MWSGTSHVQIDGIAAAVHPGRWDRRHRCRHRRGRSGWRRHAGRLVGNPLSRWGRGRGTRAGWFAASPFNAALVRLPILAVGHRNLRGSSWAVLLSFFVGWLKYKFTGGSEGRIARFG